MEELNESGKLENINKRVEIKKKLLEIEKDKVEIDILRRTKRRKEELEMEQMKVDIEKKRVEVETEKFAILTSEQKRIELEEKNLTLFQVSFLGRLLSDITVDSERTLFAGEPFLTTTLVGSDREAVRKKIIELVKQF